MQKYSVVCAEFYLAENGVFTADKARAKRMTLADALQAASFYNGTVVEMEDAASTGGYVLDTLCVMTKERDELREKLTASDKQFELVQSLVSAEREKTAALRTERDQLRAEVARFSSLSMRAMRSQRNEAKNECGILRTKLVDALAERDQLHAERDELRAELVAVRRTRDEARIQRNELRAKLETVQRSTAEAIIAAIDKMHGAPNA